MTLKESLFKLLNWANRNEVTYEYSIAVNDQLIKAQQVENAKLETYSNLYAAAKNDVDAEYFMSKIKMLNGDCDDCEE